MKISIFLKAHLIISWVKMNVNGVLLPLVFISMAKRSELKIIFSFLNQGCGVIFKLFTNS